jgi:large subunit ribosomal protein L4
MKVPVYNMAGEEVDGVELPAAVFEAKINRGLMHQALVRQMANARLGTHNTKGRSEINRTTAKAYRQKGTGRARHGSRRAPIFVGGGVAHGPKPRKYTKDMPRKMRRAALRSALSVKAEGEQIVLLDELSMPAPKTKEMAAMLGRLVGDGSVLILLAERDENVEKSARNLPHVKTLRAGYLNIRDLLGHDMVVMPMDALELVDGFLNAAGSNVVFADADSEEE